MPYRKPKRSYVLPVVAIVAVAGPILAPRISVPDKSAEQVELTAVPPQLTELALRSAPDILLPLGELTGLDLPDLRLSDLRALGMPDLPATPGLIAGGTGATPSADTPALTPGVIPPEFIDAVGAQVKELSREQPFSMVALTAPDLAGTTVMVRAEQPDGGWGRWYEASPIDGADGAAPGNPTGTDPIYVGNTTAVQVLVTREPRRNSGGGPETTPAAAGGAQPPPDLTAILIDPGRGAVDDQLENIAAALPDGGPRVITRNQWGADESIRCQEPTYDNGLGGITIHHTAGRNDYSRAESAGIVRAIYTYHSQTLGWCDIGYNALVDKYGQIFEGRYGGLDQPVQGAHAGGFNENTSGVAIMGDYQVEQPTDASIEATGRFVGWRARIAGLDPRGHTTMYSEGTEFTPYALGEEVQLPIVFAHRDVGNTSCPGDAAYAQMDRIRTIAAGEAGGAPSPRSQASRSDLAALADLTSKLLSMVHDNLIAEYWVSKGGPEGPLGQAASEPLPATQGQQYAKFVNGYVYTAPDGRAYEVVGKILDRFLQLGGDAGALGLPLSNPYPVAEGMRADFQNGSLILNRATDSVTTLWKTYNDTHQEQLENGAAPGKAASNPLPAAAPAPAPGPAEAMPAAPESASSPAPDTAPPPEPGIAESAPPPAAPGPDRAAPDAPHSVPGNFPPAPDASPPVPEASPAVPGAAPDPSREIPAPSPPGPGISYSAPHPPPAAPNSAPPPPAPEPPPAAGPTPSPVPGAAAASPPVPAA